MKIVYYGKVYMGIEKVHYTTVVSINKRIVQNKLQERKESDKLNI